MPTSTSSAGCASSRPAARPACAGSCSPLPAARSTASRRVFPCDETHPTAPESPYGCAKLAFEQYLDAFGRIGDLEPVILRYANIYGPRQDPKGEAGIVAILPQKFLGGRDAPHLRRRRADARLRLRRRRGARPARHPRRLAAGHLQRRHRPGDLGRGTRSPRCRRQLATDAAVEPHRADHRRAAAQFARSDRSSRRTLRAAGMDLRSTRACAQTLPFYRRACRGLAIGRESGMRDPSRSLLPALFERLPAGIAARLSTRRARGSSSATRWTNSSPSSRRRRSRSRCHPTSTCWATASSSATAAGSAPAPLLEGPIWIGRGCRDSRRRLPARRLLDRRRRVVGANVEMKRAILLPGAHVAAPQLRRRLDPRRGRESRRRHHPLELPPRRRRDHASRSHRSATSKAAGCAPDGASSAASSAIA